MSFPSRCSHVKKNYFYHAKSVFILRPDLHSFVISKGTRSNLVLGGVTRNWYDSVSVTFQYLNNFPCLKFPEIYTIILRTADDIFAVCHRKCRRNAVLWVHMTGVGLQKLTSWEVPKPLQMQIRNQDKTTNENEHKLQGKNNRRELHYQHSKITSLTNHLIN